jgi:hypothetical protein
MARKIDPALADQDLKLKQLARENPGQPYRRDDFIFEKTSTCGADEVRVSTAISARAEIDKATHVSSVGFLTAHSTYYTKHAFELFHSTYGLGLSTFYKLWSSIKRST